MQQLRAALGSRPLIAVGADVLVLRETRSARDVLLQLRRDDGRWSLPGGALEPGEALQEAARRELFEETGLVAEDLELLTVCSGRGFEHTYPNGDRIHNVVVVFRATGVRGELRADGIESSELRYFPVGALPEMSAAARSILAAALSAVR